MWSHSGCFLFIIVVVCAGTASDNGRSDLVRFRDSALRSSAASAAVSEIEEILRMGPGSKEKFAGQEGAGAEETTVKVRNMDTGEDIELAEIEARVPPSLDPGEVFRSKDLP